MTRPLLAPVIDPTKRPLPRAGFTVSAYEQTASWLLALLILIGFCVGSLLIMWITSRAHVPTRAVPVEIVESTGGGDRTAVSGSGTAVDAPTLEDLAQQPELITNDLPQLIKSLPSAFARRRAPLQDVNFTGNNTAGGGSGTGGPGVGPGEGTGEGGLSRAQRWEVRIGEGNTLADYAHQLDFFGIELGLIDAGPEVIYLHHLSDSPPQQRQGPRADEKRLYMSWRRGSLKQADVDLVRKAGLSPDGRAIVQFLPPDVENTLARIELDFAGRKAHQIRRTIFSVRRRGNTYEFFVIDQTPLAVR